MHLVYFNTDSQRVLRVLQHTMFRYTSSKMWEQIFQKIYVISSPLDFFHI